MQANESHANLVWWNANLITKSKTTLSEYFLSHWWWYQTLHYRP